MKPQRPQRNTLYYKHSKSLNFVKTSSKFKAFEAFKALSLVAALPRCEVYANA